MRLIMGTTSKWELKCTLHEFGSLCDYKFVVVCSRYDGKWLLSMHKKRDTWETQGGHFESGEDVWQTAKRELFEESGVTDADLYAICDYYGYTDTDNANGAVFLADVHSLGTIPESEMKAVRVFEVLPCADDLTYPNVTPLLIEKAMQAALELKIK